MLSKKMMSIFLIFTIIFSISTNPLVVFAEDEDLQEAIECNIEETETDTSGKEIRADINSTNISLFSSSDNEIVPMSDDAPFAGGSGTEEDPYQVSTPEQLNEVRNYLDKHFIQICDIDMTEATSEGGVYYNNGEGWTPIGNIKTPFTGTYNGNDYTINGLTIKNKLKDSEYIGLFGVSSGSICNVKLTDGTVELSYLMYYYMFNYFAGSIVGYNKGIIKQCYNSSEISSERCAGGIAGKSTGEIIDCYNAGYIHGFGEVAGIVAVAENKILKCYNSGRISVGDTSTYNGKYYIGGIVGELQNGILSNCYNTGKVSFCLSNGCGYLCGYSSNSEIENSYCFFVGGIVEEAVDKYSESTFNNIYIDIADCNKNVSVYLSTDELKKKESFVGFDFDTVWDISLGKNNGMPYLRNLPTSYSSSHIHDWSDWNIIKEPTRIEKGIAERICKNDISHNDRAELSPLTDDSVWTKDGYIAPTCDENGSQVYTSKYGTVTEIFEAIGHDWNDWVIIKEATVTETGIAERVCKNDSNHKESKKLLQIQNEAGFAGGSGTEEDPYQVAAPEQLNNVRNYLDKHFIQICDIDMTEATSEEGICWNDGVGWTPIGDRNYTFNGVYDGGGYKISGLNIYKPILSGDGDSFTGVFGSIKNAVIQNVILSDGEYIIDNARNTKNSCHIGGLVYEDDAKSKIINCKNYNNIYIKTCNESGLYIGNICCHLYGTILNCMNYGNILINNISSRAVCCGGLSAQSEVRSSVGCNANIQKSVNFGNITSNCTAFSTIGGIIGSLNWYPIASECYNAGNIYITISEDNDNENTSIGAIAGCIHALNGGIKVSNCYNIGNINTNKSYNSAHIGGLAGRILTSSSVEINNCYNAGRIMGDGMAGYMTYYYDFNGWKNATIMNYYSVDDSLINDKIGNITNVKNLSISEMTNKDNFVGFDFDTVWDISSRINDGMPFLRGVENLQSTIITGDINNDNEVDFRDAQLALQYAAGLITLTAEQKTAADVNGDGEVDFCDAQLILQYEAGMITSF